MFLKEFFYLWMGIYNFLVSRVHFCSRFMNYVETGIICKLKNSHRESHLEFYCRINLHHRNIISIFAIYCFMDQRYKDSIHNKTCNVLTTQNWLFVNTQNEINDHI